MKLKSKNYFFKVTKGLLMATVLLFSSLTPSYSQNKTCTKTEIKAGDNNPLEIPTNLGNTNNDSTFLNKEQFVDLDIGEKPETKTISACIFKNDSARILKFENGTLTLIENTATTDPVTPGNLGATRGTCTLNKDSNQVFFSGLGPSEFGFDRIYSYNIDLTKSSPISRLQKNNTNDFFIPPDLPTSTAITPNGKFLVYLQSNTTRNDIASIQSIKINEDKTFGSTTLGQDISNIVNAGNYLEFAKGDLSKNSKFIFGIFSNLQQGKAGSGDAFSIFRINQVNGTSRILTEFKKNDQKSPLPELFNKSAFTGFSGFKLIQKRNQLYLLISYFEIDSNTLFTDFSYITKLVLFKITSKDNFSKTANLTLIGKPTLTVFKTPPCDANNFHGISGTIWVVDNKIYVVDSNFNQTASKNENFFASYSINWDELPNAKENTKVIRLSSIPVKTTKIPNERNTDIVVTPNNNFALVATSSIEDITNAKIFTYSLKHSEINCSSLKEELIKDGSCPLTSIAQEADDEDLIADTGLAEKPTGGQESTTQGGLPSGVQSPTTGSTTTGRPPEFTSGSGRPQPFGGGTATGSSTTTSTTIGSPFGGKGSTPGVPPQTGDPSITLPKPPKLPTAESPILPELPEIELVPAETTTISSATSQEIDIKSINLSGEDQIIISPAVPQIIFTSTTLETAKVETISTSSGTTSPSQTPAPKAETKVIVKQISIDQAPAITTEERGGIKAGTGGYIIYLKQGVSLKSNDIKNIIYLVIDKNKKATIVPGTTTPAGINKLLAKLSFPKTINSGTVNFVTLLNKGGGKKEVISKGQMKIFESFDFVNVGEEDKKPGLPEVNKIQGKVTGESVRGGNIIRLTLFGKNFASRLIKIKGRSFISETFKTHTFISFIDETDIEILRSRVLNKGTKMLVTLRFKGEDLTSKAFNISTPKGQFFSTKMDIKLFGKKPIRSVILQLDKETDKKQQKTKN